MYILGLYRDNGKENGNYYLGFGMESYTTPFTPLLPDEDGDVVQGPRMLSIRCQSLSF